MMNYSNINSKNKASLFVMTVAVIILLFVCVMPCTAFAESIMVVNNEQVSLNISKNITKETTFANTALRHCMISQPDTNNLADGDPVYVFFPGTGEMDSIYNVNAFVKKYHIYDDVNGNVITVATKHSKFGNPKELADCCYGCC